MSEDEIRAIVASIVMHAAVAANNPATIKHNQSMISKYESQLIDCLALRDQQVTLAMVQEAVDVGLVYAPELSNWLVPDLRKVAEIAKRSLAQLPWPHGSGVDGE